MTQTFTPQLSANGGSRVYDEVIGRYSVIDNRVKVYVRITWHDSTGSGDLYITDLPFTSANLGNAWALGEAQAAPPLPWPVGAKYLGSVVPTNANYAMILGYSDTGIGVLQDAAAGTIALQIEYEI